MAGLQTYHAKRRFDVTPEPRGKTKRGKGNAYVIQKHAATRLHYDLRLELDGVMKSWAVTRGPSLDPGEKRLAVHVEDHPVEYNQFEGTIPKDQYGGGTVMIWDRGTWEPEGDPHKAYKKGHLSFRLDGEKLQGTFHLVRMRKRSGETRENWLLIKGHDENARGPRDPDILEEMPLSSVSGRSMDEIAKAQGAVWHSNKSVKENAAQLKKSNGKTKSARGRGTTRVRTKTPAKAKAKKAKGKRGKDDTESVPGARAAALPKFVPPCLATLSEAAPRDAGWLHEIKFDGYRMQARLDHGRVALFTRKGLDWTDKFKAIAAALKELPVDAALLDGEIVSLDERGMSSFSLLQEDLKHKNEERMTYYVFDLLHLDGQDLTQAPLEARKDVLARLVDTKGEAPVQLSESFHEEGPVLHKHACQLGLEGIISKRRDAPYRSGRGYDWLKTKCADRQEFVVTGFTPSTADSRAIGALVLGYYDDGELHYAGRVGTGYTREAARDLWKKLQPLKRKQTPFGAIPAEERGMHGAQWVEPKLVVEVDFHGWTHGNRVRQASFQGLREDKSPTEVVREKKVMPAAAKSSAAPAHRRTGSSKGAPAVRPPSKGNGAQRIGGIALTHPDRVYWDRVGVTKKDLADYYVKVWDWMRPHVTGRVIALLRCPEGAKGQCFFQKHASSGIDKEHLKLVSEPDGDRSISIDDLDGLITLVQGGVLEIHTRGTTIDRLEEADRLVFDLDPGPGIKWDDLVAAAREVRERLAAKNLVSFIKTSGGKGLHVVLPIRYAPWDVAKAFCRSIAEEMERDSPSRYTSTLKKSARSHKIFVDYLRNSREATAVAPYSTRARDGAPVSVPISWEELGAQDSASRYTVLNLAQRLSRLRKDPWADIGKLKQALPKARR